MRIRDRLEQSRPCFSFEFFPPKSDLAMDELFQTVTDLAPLAPGFVSVTYGAGGGNRDLTVEVITRIRRILGVEVMAHLTCVGHTRAELVGLLERLRDEGLENLLALRGDKRPDDPSSTLEEGLSHASDLVGLIRDRGFCFCVGGAAYPEGHLECASREVDLRNLKREVDAGAEFLITQLFFDNAFYFDFVERARRVGIGVPIVPGIMPITNLAQLDRFTRFCGATVPMRLRLELERRQNDPSAILQLGVAHATVQCMELLNRGVRHIHFFTLNKSPATRLIVSALKSVI